MKFDSLSRIALVAALSAGVTLPLQADGRKTPGSRGDTSNPDGQRPPPKPAPKPVPGERKKHKGKGKRKDTPKPVSKPAPKPAPERKTPPA